VVKSRVSKQVSPNATCRSTWHPNSGRNGPYIKRR
jgi:hypothetical protein